MSKGTKQTDKKADGFKALEKNILLEEPNPYFCTEEEKEFFPEFKKKYPDASIHENTGIGIAICKDDVARMIFAYQMIGASRAYGYLAGNVMQDSFFMEAEGLVILKNF